MLKERNTKQSFNDNGDNNEKTKFLKTWMGIFLVGISRGEFNRG